MHGIINTASAAGSFNLLSAALTAANLVDTLNGAGKAMAADVMTMDGQSANTVSGTRLSISTNNGVKLNGMSTAVKVDFEFTNGVIPVIDTALVPNQARHPLGGLPGDARAKTLIVRRWSCRSKAGAHRPDADISDAASARLIQRALLLTY